MRFRLAAAGMLIFVLAPELATESVTLSTYYPAPYGVYNRLMTTGDAHLARDPGARVGIGTTSPSVMLEVVGGIRFASGRGDLTDQGGNPAVGSLGGNPLLLAVNGSEKARLGAGGNLGIGVQNPTTKLEVNGVLSFTTPGAGYAKICEDVVYGNSTYTACPANTTPIVTAGNFECSEGSRGLKPCAFPESGVMRCCRIAP